MFELVQTPLHALAIPSLWDEILQLILFNLDLENTHEGLLLLKLVEIMVVILGMSLKPPFHRNIYVGGIHCQLILHCKLVLEFSLLHVSHHSVRAESEWNTFVCS